MVRPLDSAARGRLPTIPLLAALVTGAFACSASNDSSPFSDTSGAGGATGTSASTTGTSTGTDGAGGDPFMSSTSAGTGGGSAGDCSDASQLIYMIGQQNNLYSFYPPTREIKSIGVINCPQNGGFASPFSMAVDRKGIAWILFNDGKIYNVDTLSAACRATTYQPSQQGWTTFGMGFVSDTPGSDEETLYVGDYNGAGIGAIDTGALSLRIVGQYDAIHTAAEMTGTGDARLFGFFIDGGVSSSVVVAEIDKSNAHILSQAPLPTISIGSGWAFAFWGGDFYLFTNPSGAGSQIDRYKPSDGTTSTVSTNLADNIVGAGVSTCAPTESPE